VRVHGVLCARAFAGCVCMPRGPAVHWWARRVLFGVPAGAQSSCAPALLLPCPEARPVPVPSKAFQGQCRRGPRGGTTACNLRTASARCRPAARPGGDRMRVQHHAGRPAGVRARERAHGCWGSSSAACDACTPCCSGRCDASRGWCAHRRSARPQAAAPSERGARACAGSQLCAVPRRSSKHVPVSASSAAAMCLQATHHRRPVHLRASCHACARGSVALTAKMVLLGARFCRPAHRRTGWLVVWQSALAPGPCGQPHPMPWLPRAERGRGERGLAGVVKHHVRARAAAHVREARPLPLALVAAGAPPHQRMPKGCAHPLRTAWLQAFTNKTS